MKFNLRAALSGFMENDKDYPVLVGFVSGFYPLVFYYSNNYESINSFAHMAFFCVVFLLVPSIATWGLYRIFCFYAKLRPYKKHLLFVLIIEVTAIFMSQVYYLTIKKKLLLALLIITVLLALKLHRHYKKIVIFILFMAVMPLVSVGFNVIEKQRHDTLAWMKQKDAIETVKFIKKPNIYFLEPDGYAGKEAMHNAPYGYTNTIYDWLSANSFTVYKNTASNYPASLASNASMFGMKHHYLGEILPSPFEFRDARKVISGQNPVIGILRNNNYKTFFLAEDEYFQKNFESQGYDYYNIKTKEIPFFSNDDVKRDVYSDLRQCLANNRDSAPKFYFVEKLLPHHIHFDGTGVENERKVYLQKVALSNVWIKETIRLIEKNDSTAIIVVASDHGGWVGLESMEQMFATKDKKLLRSVFCNLIAIKWNDPHHSEYDAALKSNVNIFRVLFACLGRDKDLLQHLEDDRSYIIRNDGIFGRKAGEADFNCAGF